MNSEQRQNHLEFYREHKIAPVYYDVSKLETHFERRSALYSRLGLLPIAVKHANVLEVAAGTGQNSLYLAQLLPEKLVLLEPNENAIKHIYRAYADFNTHHTAPEIVTSTLEAFNPDHLFDIVICENWLGNHERELNILNKLASLVAPKGLVIITTVSPVGLVPNLLRRFLSSYIAPLDNSFEQRTEKLIAAFGPHLETIAGMTRNKKDWVHDNMINPAYFNLCLSIPILINQLTHRFEQVGSFPAFAEDWRWFKNLHGENRKINHHFLTEYWKKSHNFLDYRNENMIGNTSNNIQLENKALSLLKAVAQHEDAILKRETKNNLIAQILSHLDDFISLMPDHLEESKKGLLEVRNSIESPTSININNTAKLKSFSGLFGRETVYVSLQRM